MIVYWILLLPVGLAAYIFGSLNTITLASRYVFHYNLNRLGKGNIWLSGFRRRYGIPGAFGLLLTEVIRDAIPIVLASLILGIKGHADTGRAFAMFCLVLGQLYPITYYFRGKSAFAAMCFSAACVDLSMGVAALAAGLIVMLLTRTVAGGAVAGALIMLSAAVLIINDPLIQRLCIFTAILVVVKHIPAVIRILNRTEPRFSFRDDLSYKFDN